MNLFSTVVACEDEGDQIMLLDFLSQYTGEWGNGDQILNTYGTVDLTGMNPDSAIEIIIQDDDSFILWAIDDDLDFWDDDDIDFSDAIAIGLFKCSVNAYLEAMQTHTNMDVSDLSDLL